MTRHNTRIIGIGKPIQVMTQAHHTEEVMGDDFPLPSHASTPMAMTLVDRSGEIPFELRSRHVEGRFDIWKMRKVLSPGTLEEWQFHHVPMFAAWAAAVTEQLVAAARRGVTLYDPV